MLVARVEGIRSLKVEYQQLSLEQKDDEGKTYLVHSNSVND